MNTEVPWLLAVIKGRRTVVFKQQDCEELRKQICKVLEFLHLHLHVNKANRGSAKVVMGESNSSLFLQMLEKAIRTLIGLFRDKRRPAYA
ncbi:hypothetical protein R6Q59_024971 [Mikania micrantha]